MAVTDSYATPAEYRTALDKIDTSDDVDIEADLLTVSRLIDRWCGRHFTSDSSATTRSFVAGATGPVYPEAENPWRYARGNALLEVDDLAAAPTQVLVDENGDGVAETPYTDYDLWPLNAMAGSELRPYTALMLRPTASRLVWPPGRRVTITARWGWPAVPMAIRRACIHLTGILRLETPRAVRRTTETGEILQATRQARDIIDELVRQYGRVRF
ncbi:MAG TPA: hypothetical protein VNN07_06505 [Candidatus Tectomicrobia bacterium]|nr:hypothetical protein [Candidatus Tectomicrobia bacterium]